jgi:hypothetical protein
MPNYEFTHPDYDRNRAQWKQNRDACEGEDAVKKGGYLPNPTPTDTSPESVSRFTNYTERAVYTNASGRTVEGLVGIAFGDWPEHALPKTLEYLIRDADGAGIGLFSQAQFAVGELVTTARGGLLVDYPKVEGGASVEDLTSGKVAARMVWYATEDIHDWATTRVGSLIKLSYVKLKEKRQTRSDDGFEIVEKEAYRLLRLEDEKYTVEILVKGDAGWVSEGKNVALDSKGKPFDVIPFQFLGAQNNDPRVDKAPLTDLVKVNLGHFRNSADYEESVFMLGQPQVTMTGLDEAWRDHIEASGVYFGSRRVLMGPQGATIGLLQVQPNTLAAEAMKMKREDMVALGARLLQPGSAIKTAEQSKSETRAAYSVLSLICDNVSAAYTNALQWAAKFMGASGEVEFAISTDFDGLTFNTEVVKTVMDGVQKGLIPKSDAWATLRKLNVIDQEKTDEEIRDEIDGDGGGLLGVLDPVTGLPAKGAPGAPGGDGGKPVGAPGAAPVAGNAARTNGGGTGAVE